MRSSCHDGNHDDYNSKFNHNNQNNNNINNQEDVLTTATTPPLSQLPLPLPLAYDRNSIQSKSSSIRTQTSLQYKLRMPSVDMYTNVNYTLVHDTLARVFPIWHTKHPFPCFPAESDWYTIQRQQTPTKRGFLYFKARKAGSSTVAGIALRIAKRKAKEMALLSTNNNNHNNNNSNKNSNNNAPQQSSSSSSSSSHNNNATHCHTRYGHPAAHRLKYSQRNKAQSFLWSIIREPTQRDISEFFHFAISRGMKLDPSKQAFLSYYDYTPAMQEYYLQFMSTTSPYKMTSTRYHHSDSRKNSNASSIPMTNDPMIVSAVASIMSEYDFIGITERMHESLVVLQFLLNLTTSDLLYLSAKTSGGWDDGMASNQCYHIRPAILAPPWQEYLLHSTEWSYRTRGGNLLYATVHASLDKTIASLNATEFQTALHTYQWALKIAQQKCKDKVKFPCSAGGILQPNHDCLLWDSGCGNDCLDNVAQELGLL